ncbi:hypothetical protein [Kordiimonas gwangyangensis]|uniref:hypothetical protein n=1 Tax=Kordiimonas gwangyangensis TaxID=288022 RepID=UPI00036D4378|nr:hypothetical protein [Kordiimonas gwangyangensis]
MTKKYDSKSEGKGFWSKLATLLAPQDERILRDTREIEKTADAEGFAPKAPRRKVAAPSFDTPLSLIQNYD